MTTYLVTRHEGTRTWAAAMAKYGRLPFAIDRVVEHLDVEQLDKGDVVVGTLPVHLAARLHERKVAFWSLDLDTPQAERGKELEGWQVVKYGARLTRYEVREKETQDVAAARQRKRAEAKPQPSITLIPVSAQLAPAAIGWLHRPTDEVALLATPRMLPAAERLKAWFDARMPAPRTSIMEWDDTSYASLLDQAKRWADARAEENRPAVVINLTGGTKPMAMVLQRAFGKHRDAFGTALAGPYVDTARGAITELLGNGAQAAPMRGVLNLADQLALQGFSVKSVQSAARGYASWLGRTALFDLLMAPAALEWLGFWNRLLGLADDLVNPRKNKPHKGAGGVLERKKATRDALAEVTVSGWHMTPSFDIHVKAAGREEWSRLQPALEGDFGHALQAAGVCCVEFGDRAAGEADLRLRFDRRNLDELAFAQGGWMEVWLATWFAQAGVDEWAQGIEVKQGRTPNEFDLIAICGNRTLVVEAKAARLDRAGKVDNKATETVYKLDAVADKLGQVFSERWLVSLRPLEKDGLDRAARHRIEVFHGGAEGEHAHALTDLPAALAAWVSRCRLERGSQWRASRFPAPVPETAKRRGAPPRRTAPRSRT